MSCDNCHEPTIANTVLVGSHYEQWCEFCVEIGTTLCAACDMLIDKDEAARVITRNGESFFCTSHLETIFGEDA